MPDWKQLAKALNDELDGRSDGTEPVEIMSAYQHEHGRVYLAQRLIELLNIGTVRPGAAHRAFARIPFQHVITTNFDVLLEDGYRMETIDFFPVTGESQLSVASTGTSRVLIKLHGDVYHPDKLVVCEEDFDGFISRNPLMSTEFSSLMLRRTAVLIGYSLSDPDLRQVLSVLRDRLGPLMRPLYALLLNPSQADRLRFERRGVRVVDLGFRGQGSASDHFAQLFEEMADAARSGGVRDLISTQVPIADDLDQATGRSPLVFFSIPDSHLRLVREHFFPVVKAEGFLPATRDELSLTNNSLAAIEAIIRRSVCVVSEPSDPTTMTEAEIARRFDIPLFVVMPENSGELDSGLAEEWQSAAGQLQNWLSGTPEIQTQRVLLRSEPRRLIHEGEYRAAVAAGFALLESELRRAIALAGESSDELGFKNLISKSLDLGLVRESAGIREEIEWSARLRKSVRVGQAEVKRKTAKRSLSFVELVLDSLDE